MFRGFFQEREFWPAKSHYFPLPFKQLLRHSQNCPKREELIADPYTAVIRTEQELTLVHVALVAMNSSAVSQFVIPPPPPHKMPEGRIFPSWQERVGTWGQV